jgi:transcriptional regulator with XRE-family HTH domain
MAKPGPEQNVDEILGERIRELRTASHLPIDEVAKSAKMSASDYEKGERGKRRFSAIEAFDIARTLGIELAELLSALKRD